MRETSVPQQAKPGAHKPAEFFELSQVVYSPLSIAVFGEAGRGKTRFLATGPGNVGVVSFNNKTRRTLEMVKKELGLKKKIFFPREDFVRAGNPMTIAMLPERCGTKNDITLADAPPRCCQIHYYRWHVNRAKDAIWSLVERKDIDTIAIDGGEQFYEDLLYAYYGKSFQISTKRTAYGPINEEFKTVIKSCNTKHLIIAFESKDEYKPTGKKDENGESIRVQTGHQIPKGFGDIGYYVGALIELSRTEDGTFSASFRMCQEKASLFGASGVDVLQNDMITFPWAASLMRDDTTPDDWE